LSTIQARIEELGITLPDAPKPVAAYVPAVQAGNLVFISGQVPMRDGQLIATGPVPSSVDPADAADAARSCAINALAVLSEHLDGDLDQVCRIVRIGVFVASDPDFTGQPIVANGASELLVSIFGEAGRHARAAVGSVLLPLGATVEVEMLVQLKD
jgi:enamine deaminase RidA (YjgF/YER057c/UK114 family)